MGCQVVKIPLAGVAFLFVNIAVINNEFLKMYHNPETY